MDDQLDSGKIGNLTIKDVARALNVSTSTVSRAISGKGRIGGETVRRVQEYIQEHNYVPNVIAQSLADQRTYNIGFICPAPEEVGAQYFYYGCMAGIYEALGDTPYDVLIIADGDRMDGRLDRALKKRKIDGAIVSRALVENHAESRLREAGVPFVVIGTSPDGQSFHVDHDHRTACAELTRRLLQGGRELALMGGDLSQYVMQDRLQGFLSACHETGIQPKDEMLQLGLSDSEQTQTALDTVLKAGAECLVCMDDQICGMVLSLLHHKGLQIPQDIQVASFYDSSLLQSYTPAITALRFDAQKLGAVACHMLLNQLEGQEVEIVETVGYDIALRASTSAIE